MNSGDMAQANVIARGVSQALKSTPIKVEVVTESKEISVEDAIEIIRDYCNGRYCNACNYFDNNSKLCGFRKSCPNVWRKD